eukprot:gnl/TRDRNA2_/TRDRNA2_192112_c0_seq1.p1 gnl/TRDRNA2_/TRDRNA2_192112_c0~~gnl/TRDRNA2_/TRDRNA2_192112_c0_seq1.p1  ORF type:complete len:263 (+),score=45.14 gnl/TRDRNA2_/TRDRNA2_192112_c0_seq1:60-848(+)
MKLIDISAECSAPMVVHAASPWGLCKVGNGAARDCRLSSFLCWLSHEEASLQHRSMASSSRTSFAEGEWRSLLSFKLPSGRYRDADGKWKPYNRPELGAMQPRWHIGYLTRADIKPWTLMNASKKLIGLLKSVVKKGAAAIQRAKLKAKMIKKAMDTAKALKARGAPASAMPPLPRGAAAFLQLDEASTSPSLPSAANAAMPAPLGACGAAAAFMAEEYTQGYAGRPPRAHAASGPALGSSRHARCPEPARVARSVKVRSFL